jgi:hypothetical protein
LIFSHISGTEDPTGVIAPKPVTTTLFNSINSIGIRLFL